MLGFQIFEDMLQEMPGVLGMRYRSDEEENVLEWIDVSDLWRVPIYEFLKI